MATDFLFSRAPYGLAPACEEADEWLRKKKMGVTILVAPREPRNGAFFKKWWALIDTAYAYWADSVELPLFRGEKVHPSFHRFRKDVTISAGYYEAVVNLKGEVRIEAQSLAWASMDEDTFTKLFDASIQVILHRVFNGKICRHWSEQELRDVVDQVMEFAG